MLRYRSTGGTQRSGSSPKGGTPNICYFVAKLSIVAIYALFERLLRAFNESHLSQLSFEGLPTKVSLLSESFGRAFLELSESFLRAFGELS